MKRIILAVVSYGFAACCAQAQSAIPVTPDNFVRAETDMYFANLVRDGSFGKFDHIREPASIDNQAIIRLNRDTLYSSAIFDLDAGPVTIIFPDAGKRFMSLQVLDEDQYTHGVTYRPGSYTFDRKGIGTRYVGFLVRTLVDPNSPKDIEAVHSLQDKLHASQKSPGKFEVPDWDKASQAKVREALLILASTTKSLNGAFGAKGEVDPVHRLIGAAAGWGGNPDKNAVYVGGSLDRNDGTTIYRLEVKNGVPVDGFWSISVYNAAGYFEKNPFNAYSLNNITAKKDSDGAVLVQFGGCDGKIPNCLPITKGWNYVVRLYRPRSEILDGSWKFPQPQPVQ